MLIYKGAHQKSNPLFCVIPVLLRKNKMFVVVPLMLRSPIIQYNSGRSDQHFFVLRTDMAGMKIITRKISANIGYIDRSSHPNTQEYRSRGLDPLVRFCN